MLSLTDISVPGWDRVVFVKDKSVKLQAFISLHSLKLGPALGGCRMFNYASQEDALNDAKNLSKGMTYKNALALDKYGGGKATIIGDPKKDKTKELLLSFASAVDKLNGDYLTAQDSGLDVEDLLLMQSVTDYAILPKINGVDIDPSPWTALGVFYSMIGAMYYLHNPSASKDNIDFKDSSILKNKKVLVLGLGHVGEELCRLLFEAGANLIVADIDHKKVKKIVTNYNALATQVDEITNLQADVFAPCALGGAVNNENIDKLKVKIICGGANNQLAENKLDKILFENNILYCPDYVVNAAGVMAVAGGNRNSIVEENFNEQVSLFGSRIFTILQTSKEQNLPTHKISDKMVEYIIQDK